MGADEEGRPLGARERPAGSRAAIALTEMAKSIAQAYSPWLGSMGIEGLPSAFMEARRRTWAKP
jgi:hypothetical protein